MESIPGLESALYAQARLRGTPLLQHADPAIQRLLLDGQAEVAEAKALKNLRLHERRLRRQFEQDKAELNQLRQERFEQVEREQQAEAARQQEEAEQERRQEQARKRAARKQARQAALADTCAESEPMLLDTNGFEFANSVNTSPDTAGEPDCRR